jgi:hypothetical protein
MRSTAHSSGRSRSVSRPAGTVTRSPIGSELGPDPAEQLQSKIDVGPPPWLPPVSRSWVEVPIHDRYGGPLPSLLVVDLAENVAEKIARLNRRSPARDAYDLVWVVGTPGLDLDNGRPG